MFSRKISFMVFAAVVIGGGGAYAHFYTLSDPVDAYAASVLNKAQRFSFRDNAEYCGLIGYDENERLISTKPQRGDRDGCTPEGDDEIYDIVASYHTHGAYALDADTEVPSSDDLYADFEEGVDGYIATPGGRLWVNILKDRKALMLCGPGCLISDPKFKPCPALMPKDRYTIRGLKKREASDNGEC